MGKGIGVEGVDSHLGVDHLGIVCHGREVGTSPFQCRSEEKECPWLGLRSGSAVEGHRELAGYRTQAAEPLANSHCENQCMTV